MANLKYGSSGEEVKKLQNALIDAGYDVGSTGADGVFGKNTQAAVQAYQKANGLAVDGIAGVNTLGKLYGTSNTTPAATTTTATDKTTSTATNTNTGASAKPTTTVGGFTYEDFTYEDYAPSDIVNQANALIQQQQGNKPGAYTPVWQDEADAYLTQYQNRDPFSYDFNSDALYNQYKDNYIRQGQMAMMDTMGQAQAMTGGYGNSYAQSVGQQAYQQQLSQLNNVLPELWQMSYDRYNQEGQDMLSMYGLYMDRENQAYNQYQTELDNWYQEMNRLTDNYNTLYARDYGEYVDKKSIAYDKHLADKDLAWDQYLSNLDKEQSAAEIMAGAGNYDRLKDVYGLTDDEVAAIKKANTPVVSTGGNGSAEPKYGTLGTDDKSALIKILGGATSMEELGQLAQIYGAGYSPDEINGIVNYIMTKNGLTADDKEEDEIPITNVHGGGGGKWYAVAK